jgi:RNA polymerase sigma factor (sigma-70 family)
MGSHKVRSDPPGPQSTRGLNTRELLRRARAGEENALNTLFARFLPHLQRWAHRRVPGWARNGADSSDFVQDTVLQTIRNLSSFEPRRDGALLGYLRRSLINRIRNQFRQAGRHPHAALGEMDVIDPAASPLEFTIDHQNRARYVAALAKLRSSDRTAIIGRIELGYSYEQLALILDKPTPGAARLAIRRALLSLADEMRRG